MSNINLHNYEVFLMDYLDGKLDGEAVAELKSFIIKNQQLNIDLNEMDLPSVNEEVIKADFKKDLKKTDSFIEDEELINYIENNLTETEKKLLESKLEKDKELNRVFKAYKKTILKADESSVLSGKQALRKTEEQLILNNAALAFTEKQLTATELVNFKKELNVNVALQTEVLLFQKTKLVADHTVVFENKSELKKEPKVIALFGYPTITSVAATILLLIGLFFVFNYYTSKPVTEHNQIAKTDSNKKLNKKKNAVVISNSINNPNSALPENTALIASKEDKGVNNNAIKNSTLKHKKINESASANDQNKVATNKQEQEPILKQFSNKDETKVAEKNSALKDTSTVGFANNEITSPKYSKQNYLIATEEDDNEDVAPVVEQKKSFWQRAVKLAKQVNKLGVKSVDGNESQGKNYSLSFNSFSVEKR